MKNLILCILLVLLSIITFGQGFSYKLYTTEDGLLSNTINGISQDSKGNLWVGHRNGFSKFDGKSFQVFYDKKIDGWNWNYRIFETTEKGGVVYTAGLNLAGFPNQITNQKVDSSLIYRDRPYQKRVRQLNLIDSDEYRIFSSDRSKIEQSNGDTVFYQKGDVVSYSLLPKKLSRTISKIRHNDKTLREENCILLVKDNQGTIYLRVCDTIKLTNIFYLFKKGKISKVVESGKLSSETRIVGTPNGNHWFISNVNQNLIAECYNPDYKLIKRHEFKNLLGTQTLWNCSKMLSDSKSNIWFSWIKGLMKINLEGLTKYQDDKRTVLKKSQVFYDANGKEFFNYMDDYSNFINAFAIDKYDNIISGERLFDGYQFTYITSEDKFTELFNEKSHTLLNDCYVDRENNIWFGTNTGLIKLSATPFKKIDTRLSFKEPEFELVCIDNQNRKYYIDEQEALGQVILKIYKDSTLLKERVIKSPNMGVDLIVVPEGVLITYDNEGEMVIEYEKTVSLKKITVKTDQSYLLKLYSKKDETLFYLYSPLALSKAAILLTSNYFKIIAIPDSIAIQLQNSNRFSNIVHTSTNLDYVITDNLNAYKLRAGKTFERVQLPGIGYNIPGQNEFYFYLEANTGTTYYMDKNGTFLKIKNNKIDIFKNEMWDSLSKVHDLSRIYTDDKRSDPRRNLVKIKDLYVFWSPENLIIFKEFAPNKIKFSHKVMFAEQKGLENFNAVGGYSENNYLALQGETDLKVASYENILEGNFSELKRYPIHAGLNKKVCMNEFGQRLTGNYISYLGKRGFNEIPPILSDFEIIYMKDGKVNIDELKNLGSITIPYSNTKTIITYKAICLTDGSTVKYKYKLEGYDPSWQTSEEASSKYTSLAPGSYTLKVFAANNEGVWTKEYNSLIIKITPPWYKNWLAYLFYVLLTLTGFYVWMKSRTRQLEKEKNKLEQTVFERTSEIVKQKHLIEEKHKEITDSINYAERIQRSFLASKEILDANFKDYFVLFQPKDVVSGDFYWAGKLSNGNFTLVTADSTGHGVPGAIMSILNISCLENAIKENIYEPKEILNHTRVNIIERLKKDGSLEGGKDGMDCSLVSFDFKNSKIIYTGANNPIWIIRNNELLELEPDKMPVGKHDKDSLSFTQQEFDLLNEDMIYTLTDGYPDQFGGPKGKKFMYKKLKEILLAIAAKPLAEQQSKLTDTLNDWKGSAEQVDDITIIGIRF